jgi:hypothetical protein
MTPSQLADLKNDDLLRKHLAKLMARDCFRNSRVLEDFHGGTSPSSETGDFSDVRVVSPFGEIAWNDLLIRITHFEGRVIALFHGLPAGISGAL